MNTLPLIRSHIERAQRLHKAQLISAARGSRFHEQSGSSTIVASRKEKARRLSNAQMMAF